MPTTNPFDRKLATVLKALNKGLKDASAKEKVGKDYQSVRSRVVDATLGTVLDDLFKSFSTPADQRVKPEQAHMIAVIRTLCDRQFPASAAFLFAAWRDCIASLPLDAVLPLIPDAASFENWRKASVQPAKEVEQRLLAVPGPTYMTAGADWCLLHATPEKQLPLLDLFLSRQSRPKFLPSWAEALALALQKNKKGALLRFCLEHPWPREDRLVTLAEVVRLDVVLMHATIDAMPKILTAKEAPASAVLFVRQLFANLITTTDEERQFATASLARLGTGILLQHFLGPRALEAMAFIEQTTRQLRGVTRGAELQSRTWILESLQAEKALADGGLQITFDGARRFAVAYERARQGLSAADLLSTIAKNLGLTIINTKGEQVTYNPLEHEDSQGGIRPSELVLVLEPGLKYQNTVVLRALVGKVGSK
jgi:hypothetical protein